MHLNKKLILGIAIALCLLSGGGILAIHMLHKPVIPKLTLSRITFPVYAARSSGSNQEYKLDSSSVSVTQEDQDYFIKADYISKSNTVTVTQQSYPDVLIPDQFLAGSNQYDTVSTAIGSVSLARPKNAGGKQVAIALPDKATLLFAYPKFELSKQQWQQFFENFKNVNK